MEFGTRYQFLDIDFDVVEAGLVVGTGVLMVSSRKDCILYIPEGMEEKSFGKA